MGKCFFYSTRRLTLFLLLAGCASKKKTAPLEQVTVQAPEIREIPPATPMLTQKSEEPKETPHEPVVQSVTISLPQISQELGIPRNRLEQQTEILARFLKTQKFPHSLCSDEDDDNLNKLCELMELVENNARESRSRRDNSRRVPLRPHLFAAQQSLGYSRLMRSLHREPISRVLAWIPRITQTKRCPRNLSAAALRKLESGLPHARVRTGMERLYRHAAVCLKPQDEGYEITHLRQGLLRLQWGMTDAARLSFERAALAEESSDKTRVLYWAGRLQKTVSRRNRYWNQLLEEHPLSFHALEVWRHRQLDPLQIFEARPPFSLTRHVENEDVNNAMRWLEALYVLGKTEAGQKLARWINTHYKDDIPPSTALYVSALKSSRGTPLNTITFLTRQVSENPQLLNQQTLRLLFPRPFYDVFDRNSPRTDTSLILAVARQESGFNPHARSPANARGLLQLLPSTARQLSGRRRNNLYDSETNARLGTRFLSRLIEKFGSVEVALSAYNAGPGRAQEWMQRYTTRDLTLFMDLIPFKETRYYVANILRNNYWYDRLYTSENAAMRSLASSPRSKSQKSRLVTRLVEAHLAARQSSAEESSEEL